MEMTQEPNPRNKNTKLPLVHIALFILTFLTTSLTGAEWRHGNLFFWVENGLEWSQIADGFPFAVALLFFLTTHEMGHYLTARYYKLLVTLPFYLPMYLGWLPLGFFPGIGTLGAYIRLKMQPITTRQYFDVGVAGPIAGFVVALGLLWYGFTHLPPLDYLFGIHPEYKQWGADYAQYAYQNPNIRLGDNLLLLFFKHYVADPTLVPNNYELAHYPVIFAGYIGLLVTSLNMLPLGQLDGGHVMYGLLGHARVNKVSPWIFKTILLIVGCGAVSPMALEDPALEQAILSNAILLLAYYVATSKMTESLSNQAAIVLGIFAIQYMTIYFWPTVPNLSGYLVFLIIVGRFLGLGHPAAMIEIPLDRRRKTIGYLALLIFVLCFTPFPFEEVANQP